MHCEMFLLTFSSLDRNSHIGIADELHSLTHRANRVMRAITFIFIFVEISSIYSRLVIKTAFSLLIVFPQFLFNFNERFLISTKKTTRSLYLISESIMTKKIVGCASFIYWNAPCGASCKNLFSLHSHSDVFHMKSAFCWCYIFKHPMRCDVVLSVWRHLKTIITFFCVVCFESADDAAQ